MVEPLIRKAENISPISFSAAQQYCENKEKLIDEVNRVLTANPDIHRLIGHNPLSLLYDNHNNHAAFMCNIFKLNDFTLMARVVFWAYRTYKNHGFSYDYFPGAMQAWMEAVRNNLDPDKAQQIINAYQWILDNHEEIIEASKETSEPPRITEDKWQQLCEPFLSSLLESNHKESLQLANDSIHSAADLANFYLQVIQPAMYRIGKLWEDGEISVAQEHLASAIVSRVMASLYPRFIMLEQNKGKAVVTAAPNEFHEIGPRMVADLLEINGWDIDYLGANTPVHDLLDLLKDKHHFFLAISVGMPFNIDRTSEIITAVKDTPSLKDTRIMLGGHSIFMNPHLNEKIKADGTGASARDAVLLAEEWWGNA